MRNQEIVGKKCYDHLGGKLGAALFQFLKQQGWIREEEGTNTYLITEEGYRHFEEIGLKLPREQ